MGFLAGNFQGLRSADSHSLKPFDSSFSEGKFQTQKMEGHILLRLTQDGDSVTTEPRRLSSLLKMWNISLCSFAETRM